MYNKPSTRAGALITILFFDEATNMAKIDVYKDWLKIEATNRPLDYYQLLKLKRFEDDTAAIRKRYRDLNAYVRKFATGDFIEESQALLNELAKAMLCLTDSERKAEYDHSLGRKFEGSQETDVYGRRSLEAILLSEGAATPDQIKKAKNFGDAVGLDLHQALLQQKGIDAEKVMIAYAESVGLPFVNLDEVPVDEYFVPFINPVTARQNSFVPVMSDMGKLILASPEPLGLDVEDELRLLFDMPVRCAICMTNQANAAIAKYYPRDAVQKRYVNPSAVGDEPVKAKKAEKKTKPKSVKTVEEDEVEMSVAAKKNRIKISILCFNFAFMLGAFGAYFGVKHAAAWKIVAAGLVLGAIAGACGWFFSPKEVDEE